MRQSRLHGWKVTIPAAAGVLLCVCQRSMACATCYTDALGPRGMHAIKSGILILLLPAAALFSGLLLLAFRYRNSCPSWHATSTGQASAQTLERELLALSSLEAERRG